MVPGWHTLRHSFASICASRGIDQRLINAWMGHQTEEQQKRYQHLFPQQQRQAIDAAFGMINHGQRPWYREIPLTCRLRGAATDGGVELEPSGVPPSYQQRLLG